MKKSQIKELRSKTKEELQKLVADGKMDLARIYIDLNSKKLRNTALVANKKKMIATILTILSERKFTKL